MKVRSLFLRGLTFPEIARNRIGSSIWPAYSRLFLVSDGVDWSLSWDMRELGVIAQRVGIQVVSTDHPFAIRRQAIFFASQFALLNPAHFNGKNRFGLSYFHGRPSEGEPDFSECYRSLVCRHENIHRIQVSHTAMRDLVLESGIMQEKVFLIPIGINLSYFQMQTSESRRQARRAYNLPQSAVVVGSFQKDGVGWGEGLEPKKIKGPDIFLKVIGLLKPRVPELFVLLSGPARGYVKAGLEKLGVPYHHFYLKSYAEVGRLFQALDVYLVCSREEGGPKAVLESMASGVPLVTTRVGQAMDLVQHGENGWMVEVDDAEGLADWAQYVIDRRNCLGHELRTARLTAEGNTYDGQTPLWRNFFHGFVEIQ